MFRRQGTVQNFTLTATAQLSSPFGSQTRRVWLSHTSTGVAMAGAFILFGDSTSITASSSNGTLLPQAWLEAFDVTPGQRVSVIEASTSHGTLSVMEMQ
jgi:hypothetical protein